MSKTTRVPIVTERILEEFVRSSVPNIIEPDKHSPGSRQPFTVTINPSLSRHGNPVNVRFNTAASRHSLSADDNSVRYFKRPIVLSLSLSGIILGFDFIRGCVASLCLGVYVPFVSLKLYSALLQARQDYKASYLGHMASPSNTATLAAYLDAHNNYVTQLHATNGMVETYSHETLPLLLQELEEVYSDLCTTLTDSVLQGAEVISTRATEQARRYEVLSSQCRGVTPSSDLVHFVRSLSPLPVQPHPSHRLRLFTPPQPPHQDNQVDPSMVDGPPINDVNAPPPLKNELVVDRLASVQVRSRYETLRVEAAELETQIKQLQDALDTMARIQQRSLESQLYNKVNELQEDISIKKFDLRTAQIHLAAVRAQHLFYIKHVDFLGTPGIDKLTTETMAVKNAGHYNKRQCGCGMFYLNCNMAAGGMVYHMVTPSTM
ncbi:hypothetical protein J6590_046089 [Homalodisca vitripennis]|nr:hypothetical protein J6590_046089 [Homalodisca vitripennis]